VRNHDFDERVGAGAFAPLLIVGAPRSGTTLAQRMLLADPRCAGGQESHFFATIGPVLREFDRKRAMARPHGMACYWTREEAIAKLRQLWLDAFGPVLVARPQATHLVEKTPDHALWLDVAAEVVPNARVLHVVRDSRAVVASLLRAGRAEWGRAWAPKSIDAAIQVWRRHVEAALASPLPTHLVRMEDLIEEPARELTAIAEFAGFGAEALCLEKAMLTSLDRSTRAFVAGGAVGAPPDEPEGFLRSASESRDGWRQELGWWDERRVWKQTRDILEVLGYARTGLERRA
jgi:hypothetical protein